jgi:hypothetical protein
VCQAIRQGRAVDALANLHQRGRIHLSPNPSTAIKEVVHAWDRHRRHHGLDQVKIVTDTDNHTIDTLNDLCQARRLASGELNGPPVEITDQPTGRRERLHEGDRVCFTRPYRHHGHYVANGTRGTILAVVPRTGRVTIACDDGHTATLDPGSLTGAQPLRLAYAGHALRLQGGQATVVLVLPGGWQTSRQSAYSMLTRCVEEVHLFVDRQTQCAGSYVGWDPIDALADRWTTDAKKLAATARRGVEHVSELVVSDPIEIALSGPAYWESPTDPPSLDLAI